MNVLVGFSRARDVDIMDILTCYLLQIYAKWIISISATFGDGDVDDVHVTRAGGRF